MKYFAPLPMVLLFSIGQIVSARPLVERYKRVTSPNIVNQVTLEGITYVNKGMVGFGLIPSNFKESTGDTLGAIGSAIALKPGTWQKLSDGSFKGTLFVHPDRAFNKEAQSRRHEIDFTLNPYYDTENLDFTAAQKTLTLHYSKTIFEYEFNNKTATGLDPAAVRSGTPNLPTVSMKDDRLVLDIEGMAVNPDGSYWLSDEFGPHVYLFSQDGHLQEAIAPPDAILPRDSKGKLVFTSDEDPVTGRSSNQGFEGLTINPSTGTLYAMLQSATIQDGGTDKATSRYTRLFAWETRGEYKSKVVGEWVVPLPLSSKNKTQGCSEILFVRDGVFLALSRDSDGRGGDDNNSKYRQADLFSINGATDIYGSKFDNFANPIAVKGVLDSSITPATYVPFVSFIDTTQIARFGVHNGSPDDNTLLDSRWESLAIASVGEPEFPDDYFLFTVADNNFMSTEGVSLGEPFDEGLDVDNQFAVFRVTLPGAVA